MDIKSISPIVVSSTAAVAAVRPMSGAADSNAAAIDTGTAQNANNVMSLVSKQGADSQQAGTKEGQSNPKLSKQDLQDITEGLNDFMVSMNTDIKFVLHTKMKELVVQVVDTKSHKVLRESPPKEILDTLARIRDFVGALLDKKA